MILDENMSKVKKLRMGVIGCANIAWRAMIPAMIECSDVQLVAVASRSKAKAQKFADRFNCDANVRYQDILARDDIDAVYIPLPIGLHYEWVLKAFEYNKHVIVEKSLSHNFECAKEMIREARNRNLGLIENFMFIFHSQHQFVKDKIEKGEIGEIRSFRSSFGFPPLDEDNIRYNKELGGGSLLDAGAYTLKASQLFLGEDLKVQAASLKTDEKYCIDIFGGAFLKSGNGLFAEVAFGFDNYYQCNYEIWGNKGKITTERAFTAGPGCQPRIVVEKQNEKHEYTLPSDNHFVNILKEFSKSISDNIFEPHYIAMYNQARLVDEVFDCAKKK